MQRLGGVINPHIAGFQRYPNLVFNGYNYGNCVHILCTCVLTILHILTGLAGLLLMARFEGQDFTSVRILHATRASLFACLSPQIKDPRSPRLEQGTRRPRWTKDACLCSAGAAASRPVSPHPQETLHTTHQIIRTLCIQRTKYRGHFAYDSPYDKDTLRIFRII